MDSKHHAEQLTAPVCRVISAVGWWSIRQGFYPCQDDLERAGLIREEITALIRNLAVLNYTLGEEIAATEKAIREREARQEPVVDVLAGAEGLQ